MEYERARVLVIGGDKDDAGVEAETRDDVDEKTSRWLLYKCLVPVISATKSSLYASRPRVAKIVERSRTPWP